MSANEKKEKFASNDNWNWRRFNHSLLVFCRYSCVCVFFLKFSSLAQVAGCTRLIDVVTPNSYRWWWWCGWWRRRRANLVPSRPFHFLRKKPWRRGWKTSRMLMIMIQTFGNKQEKNHSVIFFSAFSFYLGQGKISKKIDTVSSGE